MPPFGSLVHYLPSARFDYFAGVPCPQPIILLAAVALPMSRVSLTHQSLFSCATNEEGQQQNSNILSQKPFGDKNEAVQQLQELTALYLNGGACRFRTCDLLNMNCLKFVRRANPPAGYRRQAALVLCKAPCVWFIDVVTAKELCKFR